MSVRVPIDFIANVDGAAKEFKQLTTILKGIGGAFVVDKILDGVGTIIDAAADAEESFNSMVSSMRLAGDYSEQNAEQFQKLAEEIQNTSKFDDDLVLSQVAVAKQFGATNKQAEQMIRAATELSAATGQDLGASMQLLGKSLDGTAGKLNELVPGMKQLTAEQLAAGAASDLVLKRFSGAAAAQLDTFNGALGQTKNTFGNLLENLGDVIVKNPAVIATIQLVSQAFQELASAVSDNSGGLQQFVATGIQIAVEAFGVLIQAIQAVDTGITNLTAGFKLLKGDFDGVEKTFDAAEKRRDLYTAITDQAAKLSVKIGQMAFEEAKATKQVEKTNEGFDKQVPKIQRVNNELLSKFQKLQEETKNLGATEEETIVNNFNEKIRLIREAQKFNIKGSEEAETIIKNLTIRKDKEVADLRKKERDERIAEEEKFLNHLKEIQANPIKVLFDKASANTLGLSQQMQEGVSGAAGVLSSVLGGKEGARNMVGNIGEALGKYFLGIPGLGEIAKVLSQGPDKVRELVREFAKALPELIKNVLLAIPVVIEELAKAVPDIIEALVDAAPEIITKLIESIPRIAVAFIGILPRLVGPMAVKFAEAALKFIDELVANAGRFVEALIKSIGDGIARVFDQINPFKGGGGFNPTGGGGFGLGGDKGLLGGGIIPGLLKGGVGGLSIPAAQKGSSSSQESGPGSATIVVQIERREIAKAIVDLNRLGYRLA